MVGGNTVAATHAGTQKASGAGASSSVGGTRLFDEVPALDAHRSVGAEVRDDDVSQADPRRVSLSVERVHEPELEARHRNASAEASDRHFSAPVINSFSLLFLCGALQPSGSFLGTLTSAG